jgi:hypothetical protein
METTRWEETTPWVESETTRWVVAETTRWALAETTPWVVAETTRWVEAVDTMTLAAPIAGASPREMAVADGQTIAVDAVGAAEEVDGAALTMPLGPTMVGPVECTAPALVGAKSHRLMVELDGLT